MSSLSDAVPAPGSAAAPLSGKIEFRLRGAPADLKRLRDELHAAGVYVQVDHEFRNSVWPDDGLVVGALLVPVAERVGEVEAGADV